MGRRAAVAARTGQAGPRPGSAARLISLDNSGRRVSARECERLRRDMDRPLDRAAPDGRPEHSHRSRVQPTRLAGAVGGTTTGDGSGAGARRASTARRRAALAQPLRPPRQTGREAHRPRAPGRDLDRAAQTRRIHSRLGRERGHRAGLVGAGVRSRPARDEHARSSLQRAAPRRSQQDALVRLCVRDGGTSRLLSPATRRTIRSSATSARAADPSTSS